MRVLPKVIVTELQNGAGTLSFAVQTASIGCIKVRPKGEYPESEKLDASFRFRNSVFTIFDEYLGEFEQLNRIRTSGDTYVYAGGVFGSVNKPDKHAEEATRFAVKLIRDLAKIEERVGVSLELTIGLNTGGPLVAGVVGIQMPHFQLIGQAFELAEQMMVTGLVNQVQLTRSVYELIYAYNFNVLERGDIKISGNRTLRTYLAR